MANDFDEQPEEGSAYLALPIAQKQPDTIERADIAYEAFKRNYPDVDGNEKGFGSTWIDGYCQCLRDKESPAQKQGEEKEESEEEDSQDELCLAKKEIERLKGLIEASYVAGAACSNNIIHTNIPDYVPNAKGISLKQFKLENNL